MKTILHLEAEWHEVYMEFMREAQLTAYGKDGGVEGEFYDVIVNNVLETGVFWRPNARRAGHSYH